MGSEMCIRDRSHLGLIQFVTPVLQLLCGVLLLGETMPPSRWVGFGVVWIALTVLSVDAVSQQRPRRRTLTYRVRST